MSNCDRLKPVLYTDKSYVIRERDPVGEMLFVTRGNLISATTNGGRTGFLPRCRASQGKWFMSRSSSNVGFRSSIFIAFSRTVHMSYAWHVYSPTLTVKNIVTWGHLDSRWQIFDHRLCLIFFKYQPLRSHLPRIDIMPSSSMIKAQVIQWLRHLARF